MGIFVDLYCVEPGCTFVMREQPSSWKVLGGQLALEQ